MKRYIPLFIFVFAILGIFDSGYLTIEHLKDTAPPCSINVLYDCGKVLRSKYSEIFGIPLALLGLIYYSTLTSFSFHALVAKKRIAKYAVLAVSSFGFLFSLYLVYLQLVVLNSICLYCMASALISTIIFLLSQFSFTKERKRLFVYLFSLFYQNIIKRILFLFEAEYIHNSIISFGEALGNFPPIKIKNKYLVQYKSPVLKQNICGIDFNNPVGLAAGFDYEARLTQYLSCLGFGFETVGTITNMPYKGNPLPRLGRLPQSRSLMVNKGFKSSGAKSVANNLKTLTFNIPVGISIGRTNSEKLKTQKQSVSDIVSAFDTFEKSNIKHSYYELNISCPNLIHGKTSFYPPKNLEALLAEIDRLKIKKPIFVKMPIEKSNRETLSMLKVISKHSPSGVIFGNLQKDRKHPGLVESEVKKFQAGYFSGKPTYSRSNELIALSYKHYKDRFITIGCGGIFSGTDAYEKITLGASLVQLITGLIYQGPQLVSQINFELEDILEKRGFANISDAVGSKNK